MAVLPNKLPDSGYLKGQPLVDVMGETVGTIDDVYLDPGTGRPAFLEVKSGRFRRRLHFVPVARMRVEGGAIRVPYAKRRITDAPPVPAGASQLDPNDEAALRRYWGLG